MGATYIRQDDDVRGGDLLGLDATLQLTASTKLVAEVAGARNGVGTDEGQADLIRLEHAGERFTAQVTSRRQEDGFGLAHEMASRSGLETLSGEAVLRINRTDAFDLRVAQNELGGLGRDFGEVALRRRVGAQNYRLGFLSASDEGAGISGLRSDLVFAEVSYGLPDERLTLGALHAQPLTGRAANPDFPGRTALRADWAVIDDLSLFAVHEWQEGDAFDGVLTRAGLTGSPWRGGQAMAGAGVQSSESGERLMSNLGLSQAWSLDGGWSVSAALDARQTLRGEAQSPLPSSLRNADWIGEDYSAASLGLAHAGARSGFSARLEGRVGQADDRLLLHVGGYDEFNSPLSLATDFTLQANQSALGDAFPLIRFRQGAAVRDGLRGRTVFYRLDLFYREVPAEQQIAEATRWMRQWRAVGNALLSLDTAPDTELNLQFGLKLSNDEIFGDDYTSIVGLIGADWRYDLSALVDIGVSGSVITVWPSDETSGHLGISFGVNPAENLWLSTGFNLVGYQESDFVGGAYRSEGLFARLRLKFDQETARSVLAD